MRNTTRLIRNWGPLAVALSLAPFAVHADHGGNRGQNRLNHYQQINLVSDMPGVAMLQDLDLVNAWGISFRAAGSPFWISDNGTSLTTLYKVTYNAGMPQVQKVQLDVTIPGDGTPSGQVSNPTSGFNGDLFLFVSEDGTISGWRPALGTMAEPLGMPPTAVYKGVTIWNGMLLAANFHSATIDMFDGNMNLQGQAMDPMAPSGYAPFNVANIGGAILVTFAKQDAPKHDDVPGAGNGFIDILDPASGAFTRFVSGSAVGGHLRQINSPWGMAWAPSTFGKHANQLLVGNFGSGTIMSFDASGDFKGLLQSTGDGPVMVDGLWALTFGGPAPAGRPSTLYFTAGPNGESNGLFGSLDPVSGDEDNSEDN